MGDLVHFPGPPPAEECDPFEAPARVRPLGKACPFCGYADLHITSLAVRDTFALWDSTKLPGGLPAAVDVVGCNYCGARGPIGYAVSADGEHVERGPTWEDRPGPAGFHNEGGAA